MEVGSFLNTMPWQKKQGLEGGVHKSLKAELGNLWMAPKNQNIFE